ncbi:S8 family serine peptidase [bacterium]|nr:S8 family serine peptidase [bacterium]
MKALFHRLITSFLFITLFVCAVSADDRVRAIVQLSDPSLSQYKDTIPTLQGVLQARTADGHLNILAPACQAYVAYLAQKQAALEPQIVIAAPGLEIHWRYRIGFNGFALKLFRSQINAVRKLPGVVAVTETYPLEFETDESRNLLGISGLWSALPPDPLGAGAGQRVALIDSGTNANHPFFNPSGYQAPSGYPRAERVAGGVRTPLPVATFASNKVIVASTYAPPGDTTATPFGPGSLHATHVAGIMAGVEGIYQYNSGTEVFNLNLSGMAPGAYIMSYRLDGDTAEFIAAIEDVIKDEADSLNISLGHSRWLTTDSIHDPVKIALEGATDAGVIVCASAGNAGANGDSNITGSWKNSERIITVASSTHARLFSNAVSVTGAPPSLQDRVGIPGAAPAPPIVTTISGEYVVTPGGTSGSAGQACAALPAGSMTGKIALVSRGTCTFDAKKNNVMAAGAVAMIVHNNADDPPTVMGGFNPPVIPSVMISKTDGLGMVTWAAANAAPNASIKGPVARLTTAWPDTVSSFSSRGPSAIMTVKPDIAAPGANILSSITDAAGTVTPPFFEQLSGTSMSTPHITGIAALVKALHPTWTPAQVKSAIMNDANTAMFLDTAFSIPALAKHRGAGRVDAARLVNPDLTFTPSSVSFGLLSSGQSGNANIIATDMRGQGQPLLQYTVSIIPVIGHSAVNVTAAPSSFSSPGGSFTLNLSTSGAPAGDFEGFVEITGNGKSYRLPYYVRIQDASAVKDVLLIDWDRTASGAGDFRSFYTGALSSLGLTYDVFDGGISTAANGNPGVTLVQLQNYRTAILYMGDNFTNWSTTHVGGSFPLQDYLTGGGKLIAIGQDLNSQILYNQNTGSDFNLTSMAGFIRGFEKEPANCTNITSDADFYAVTTPADVLITKFELFGREGDVSVNNGGDGANNQIFPDAGRKAEAADKDDGCIQLYNAENIAPHARVLGNYQTTTRNGIDALREESGVATGVAPDLTLENETPKVNWSAALLHVGLEGLNSNLGDLTAPQALGLLLDFVNDDVSVALAGITTCTTVQFTANATSSRQAEFTKYRWDFGDGTPFFETTTNIVSHSYPAPGDYVARVQAIDALTRSDLGKLALQVDPPPAIDDSHAAVEYTGGWHFKTDSAASNGGYHVRVGSNKKGAATRVVFEGTGITYFYALSSSGGTADIYIDGVKNQTLSYAGTGKISFGHSVSFSNLANGTHEIRIVHVSGTVYVDGFQISCDGEGANASAVQFRSETDSGSANSSEGALITRTFNIGPADQEVSVLIEGSPMPLGVKLLDPAGNLIASGQALISGLSFSGIDSQLSASGVYTLQVVNTLLPGTSLNISVARTVRAD